jgi:hypothetical protein
VLVTVGLRAVHFNRGQPLLRAFGNVPFADVRRWTAQ